VSRRGAVGTPHLLRRQLLTDGSAVAVVALIVLVTAGLVAAVPRVLDTLQTDGARATVAQTGPLQRDLASVLFTPPPLDVTSPGGPGADPFAPLTAAQQETREALPPLVRDRVGEPLFAVDFREMLVAATTPAVESPADNRMLQLTVPGGVAERVRYVDGRAPTGIELTEREDALRGDEGRVLPLAVTHSGVVEAAVSRRTAEQMGLQVGSRAELDELRLTVEVVGVFEPLDDRDPYWGFDTRLLSPQENYSSRLGTVFTGVAVVGEQAYPQLEAMMAGVRSPVTLLRLPVDGGGLRAADVPALVSALRSVEGTTFSTPGRTSPNGSLPGASYQLSTDLDEVLTEHLAQRAASTAVVSLVLSGLLGVTVAVLALAGRLVVERRQRSLALAVARGASPAQLRLLLLGEGLLLGVPAALLGWLVAALAVPGEAGALGVLLPAVLGLAPAVLLPLLARPGGLRAVRRDVTGTRDRRLRLAGEVLAVLAAVAALVVLRRRGLTTDVVDAGVDPLLAATPLLLALAGAVVLSRLYPLPVAALTRALARRPSAVPFIGAARAGRDAPAGTLPLVVLLLALSTAVFGAVVSATTDRGAQLAADRTVGADARLAGLGFDADQVAAAGRVEGVDAVAGTAQLAVTAATETREQEVTLLAADAEALARVQRDVAGAPDYPAALWQPPVGGAGRLPVVVRSGLAGVGDELDLADGPASVPAVVVGVSGSDLPGVRTARPWVVADRDLLLAAGGDAPVYSTLLLDLAPTVDTSAGGADTARLEADLRAAAGTASPLLTRDGAVDRVRQGPLVAGTLAAFAVAAVVAAALAALAVVLTLVVTAPARSRLLSRLRTLGLSQRQAQSLAVWEVGPLAATAVLAGLGLGLAVPALVAPAVDLRAFTGGAVAPPYTVDWAVVGLLAGGFVALIVAAVGVTVAANRRLRLGAVLRVGEEQ